jgi:hypothetical protein
MYLAHVAVVTLFKVTIAAVLSVTHPLTYTVHPGDSLTAISVRECNTAADWPGLYAANRRRIGRDPNLILVGWTLSISCTDPPGAAVAASTGAAPRTTHRAAVRTSGGKIWGISYGYPNLCGDGDGDGWDVNCQTRATSSAGDHATRSYQPAAGGTYHGSSSMQQCIIARESGGNSQVMNGSGHYGLYQFSSSTWAAHGGNPADFGHASIAEQNQVYYATVAANGYSDWAPYDGC